MDQTKYKLTWAWLQWDELKDMIRRGEYVAWNIAAKEPMRLLHAEAIDVWRGLNKQIPSIFR